MQNAQDSLWRGSNVLELLLRIEVLFSLFLQIVLIIYGNRRKYFRKNWVLILVLWIAYQLAILLVTVSLGILFRKDATDESLVTNYAMTALWAPILLVHLGGPDTITGYSLEDNQLWLRHFLGMITQFGVACYVLWKSWNTSSLKFIAIPVFIAALVKCGERTWALMSASGGHFRDWVLRGLDHKRWTNPLQLPKSVPGNIEDAQLVYDAHSVFKAFRFLFAEFILSVWDQRNSLEYFTRVMWEQDKSPFRIIEVELGFMYDLLHTKATLFYSRSRWGTSLRIASILSTVSALIAFSIIDKRKYFRIEVLITYVLLAVAIFLEVYSVIILLSSDCAMLWICEHKRMGLPIYNFISFLRWLHLVPANKRWSNSMSQLNLISICLEEKPAWCPWFQKTLHIYELFEKRRYEYQVDVSDSLKELIFDYLKEAVISNYLGNKQVWIHRGDEAPEEMAILKFVTLDQSILLWHIATTICYNDRNYMLNSESDQQLREMSMKLSNYMMCLLIRSPFMLPNGIGHITYRHTRTEAAFLLSGEGKKSIKESTETRVEAACKKILAFEAPEEIGGPSKSVLFHARRIAELLGNPEMEIKKWDIFSRAWVEMLAYAASRCAWNNHARKLTEGGELLTHVWLLMAHLGITDRFLQVSEGNAADAAVDLEWSA